MLLWQTIFNKAQQGGEIQPAEHRKVFEPRDPFRNQWFRLAGNRIAQPCRIFLLNLSIKMSYAEKIVMFS